ncbi:unnamed protein product [Didymodactylos carnosus]|uniref:CCHC-type domain-containing protein n=1 Tax=Didymodactylos carnosus TaxID=1234261 RepID=A0A815DXH9_9BILA|nr:unnamed protein product [Didymodactylos carnosus]CAF1307173.1 unnamed protein product [Didymodactylos carnosus]CAF3815861.1 unnamed protein product [Didymodactylos carnosus]CAF4141272.1 unnamed protein product [Didymodactylos carnosus]
MTSEQVSIEEAVKRLVEVETTNRNRISKLEGQIDEMLKSFTDYREQNINSTRNELQTMSETMSERIGSIQLMTVSFYAEAKSNYDENKQQLKQVYDDLKTNMSRIVSTLNQMADSRPIASNMIYDKEAKVEEHAIEQNRKERLSRTITHTTTHVLGHPSQMSTYNLGHPSQTSLNMLESDIKYIPTVPQVLPLNGVKHSIIVPPSSAAPAFYGKHTEINGISQFLRDSALEWYCQLRLSHRRPQTWKEFTELFLAQFNSPIRKARQEQEWDECKQKENETINEFLVRLRALWREQKPKETGRDLVKHLFCRMRNDLLNLIGIMHRNASLDEVITEVQQIEDILYRRAKGDRLVKQIKQATSSNAETSPNKRYDEDNTRRITPWSNKEDSFNSYRRIAKNHQVNEVTPSRNQTTAESNMTQQLESQGNYCYTCGGYGHWARDCPTQYGNYRQERNKPYPKNVIGALDERTSRAPM